MVLFWPSFEPQGAPWEELFCVRFCLQKAREFFPGKVVLYDLGQTVAEGRHEIVFVAHDPKMVVVPETWSVLIKALNRFPAVVPCFNTSRNRAQRRDLLYYDVSTLRQAVSTTVTKGAFPTSWQKADRGLVGFRGGEARSRVWVVREAFVHRFELYAAGEPERVFRFFPCEGHRILDVGCGRGRLGKWLRRRQPSVKICGLEVSPFLLREARMFYDELHLTSFEEFEGEPESFDLVVMADVLEHLSNPWQALAKVQSLLKRGGALLGVVPNAGHWSVVQSLAEGSFEYLPWGLACVGHLRFFTEKSLRALLEGVGFSPVEIHGLRHPVPRYATAFLKRLSASSALEVVEWVFRARKP